MTGGVGKSNAVEIVHALGNANVRAGGVGAFKPCCALLYVIQTSLQMDAEAASEGSNKTNVD